MSNRIVDAILSLLPGNLYQSPDNPLQVDRLPAIGGVELDYPVYQDPPVAARRQLLGTLFMAALFAPGLVWTGHLIPVPLIDGGIYSVAILVAGAVAVRGFTGNQWPFLSLALATVSLPMIAFLVSELPFAMTAAVVGLITLGFLADGLATAQLYLKTAAPVPQSMARPVRQLWRQRWTAVEAPLRGAEFYAVGYLVLLPACGLILNTVARTRGFGFLSDGLLLFGLLAVLGACWFWVMEIAFAPSFGRRRYSLWEAATAVFRSLVTWNSYNRRQAFGAGVHRSPAGRCSFRRLALIGTLLGWACLWAGVQMPVLPTLQELVGSALAIYNEQYPNGFAELSNEPSAAPQFSARDAAIFGAEGYESEFAKMLPPEMAEKYAAERAELAAAANDRNLRSEQAESRQQTSKNLIVIFFSHLTKTVIRVLAPIVALLCSTWMLLTAMCGRVLAAVEDRISREEPSRVYTGENWEGLLARLHGSADDVEKESILLGVNARDDTPVFVPRQAFAEHTHILGDSGSGKTSRGILPLITQLMRLGDASVVVIDLKADDQSVFETIRIEAEALDARLKQGAADHPGYPFRWFTTVLDRSSFAFNPMTQPMMPMLDPDQRTDILIAALGLHYGEDFGRKYFGDANFDLLNHAIRENSSLKSLRELESVLAGADDFPLPRKVKEASTHVRSSVARLARCKALNAGPAQGTPQSVLDNAINLADLFDTPQALYVALPPMAGMTNTAVIARIFLQTLMTAAQVHGAPRKKVYLVIDEFQRIVSKNVEYFLQLARSSDIGCILANQSLADLDSVGADLVPAVRTNCRIRQIFGAGNYEDIVDILGTSGESVYASRNWTILPGLWSSVVSSMSINETRQTRLSINDILLATDAPGRNIAYIRRGEGYAQFGGMPFVMDSVHHISHEEYLNRRDASWPAGDERTLVATLADSKRPGYGPPVILGEPHPISAEVEGRSAPLPSESDEDTTGASWDDIIDPLYLQEQAEREAKRRKEKRQRRPPLGP